MSYDLAEYLADGWRPTARGECDSCHAIDVPVQPDWPAEPGEWGICESCFKRRASPYDPDKGVETPSGWL